MSSPGCYSEICEYRGSLKYDLISASSVGDLKIVENILKRRDCDIDGVNVAGWTALMYAAHYGHYNIVRSLINHKCDVNYMDTVNGRTALMLAASNGHTRCIENLIKFGNADKDMKDFEGHTAVYFANHYGHGNNKAIRALLGSEAIAPRSRSCSDYYGSGHKRMPSPSLSQMPKGTPLRPQDFSPIQSKVLSREFFSYKSENTAFSAYASPFWVPMKGSASSFLIPDVVVSCATPSEITPESSMDLTLSPTVSSLSSSPSNSSNSSKHEWNKPYNGGEFTQNPSHSAPKSLPLPSSLSELLGRIGLSQYYELFEDNAIDLYSYLTLNEDDFLKLGITKYGHVKKLLNSQMRFHETVEFRSIQESFFADWLIGERAMLMKKIEFLEEKLYEYETPNV